MAIAIALLGFNDLGSSVTPTFLSRNRFYLQLFPHCPKMNKKSMWEKKNFKISVHGTWNPAIGSSFGVQPKILKNDCAGTFRILALVVY